MTIDKGCLRCCLKHLLKAKGYIEESISFGMPVKIDLSEMDAIMLSLIKHIRKNT